MDEDEPPARTEDSGESLEDADSAGARGEELEQDPVEGTERAKEKKARGNSEQSKVSPAYQFDSSRN